MYALGWSAFSIVTLSVLVLRGQQVLARFGTTFSQEVRT
jgi:hypothetical protein